MMPVFMLSDELRQYLPDWQPGKREPDRDFLWTLAHNIQPQFAKRLISEALRIRSEAALTAEPRTKPQL